jgi:hypothetical protein
MVERFVVAPAFAFLEIDDIDDDELPAEVGRQLLYGMKRKKLRAFSLQAPQFNFILAVATRHCDVEREQLAAFVALTKKVAEKGTGGILKKQKSLELWIAEGIRQRCLATSLLFLVVATPIVIKWYKRDATLKDPFHANHFVRTVYRMLKRATDKCTLHSTVLVCFGFNKEYLHELKPEIHREVLAYFLINDCINAEEKSYEASFRGHHLLCKGISAAASIINIAPN